ncbi:glycosyltransferase family 2 protein [Candidatus Desantisbacteria bacterium CG_4_9_14_3_um_filter_40_11]|uniref:Glycosyltransferase family 2 protein n=3 Tax=unclassified Candidatus Desantisiibacteriota TaxID=3106372 RepID=A0A2M7JEG3_9BACT|nr:MAG: glycosyl transferase [Candidatus Desantisbacteria bacterium CG23_combo_of_CG06-09_8_20_14_all_40_23]PIX17782.1 MAG: glycosyltransferase family 2 protein [Candidatus Desantisbacteria bacterium CG_4_8_14_3_um_filter_40_12]PJB29480.1 MAG: glycosyltransferase family 2 protein [Candidatus Desantisbacteria bacterium CG_4_9_14_3_um_filter_40_11]
MWKNKRIQVVFPAYNEEENIRNAVEQFYSTGIIDEVIVVDNNSKDRTKEEILKTKANYIFEEVPGYGSALIRGLRESTADIIITCEPDGTFSADDIMKLLVYSGDFDIVFGTRTSKYCIWDGANMNWFLRIGNVVVAKFLEYIFNGPCLTDVGCTMKLIKKEQLDKFVHKLKVKKSHFQPEFMINSILTSKKVVEIPLNYYPRKGVSKITGSFIKAFKLGCIMILYIIYRRVRLTFKNV